MVKHHKKSEKAKSYLYQCKPFKMAMRDVESQNLPEWFVSRGRLSSSSSRTRMQSFCSSIELKQKQSDIRSFALPKMGKKEHEEFKSACYALLHDRNVIRARRGTTSVVSFTSNFAYRQNICLAYHLAYSFYMLHPICFFSTSNWEPDHYRDDSELCSMAAS
uniref:Uncharacterized protein n=1 Tax=Spongospora subterranea TaxID=70186 RepID=A0A0H5QKC8_9EUKA|eukprot:CRZ02585.1 hypothetical protein [Spongospora subterranea]